MTVLLNRYLHKISPAGFLRNPPDDPNMSVPGNQPNGTGTGDDESADDKNAGDGDDDDDEEADPDDVTVDSLFKPAKNAKDSDDDWDTEEGDNESYEATPEQIEAGKQLGLKIKAKIDSLSFDEAEIPDDMDWSDKKAVAGFMAKNQKAAVQNALGMVPDILNHGLNLILPRLEEKIRKAVGSESKKGGVKGAFEELGYTGSDRELAKTLYKRALGSFNNDPKKAATATRRAMEGLGKTNSGNVSRRGRSGDSGPTMKSGAAALDSLFPD